jgi:Acetyltransferase (GNAT) domain
MLKSKLKYLEREEIDIDKWDDIIKKSLQSRIYAYSWYLDAMTDGKWSALIIDDYVTVFPILAKKILSIPYITHPYLCQQLGLFTTDLGYIDQHSNIIIKYLKSNFLKTETTINSHFKVGKNINVRSNHILALDGKYTEIYKNYNRNTKRNINKADEGKLILSNSKDVPSFIEFMKTHDETDVVRRIEKNILALVETSFDKGNGTLIIAEDELGIHSAAFYIMDEHRIYFLLCASDALGKERKAMFLIIDDIIRRYAGQKFIFDFTGSNMENIARRNVGFGAETEIYYHLNFRWPFF